MIILKELQIYSEEDLGIKLKVNNTILNEIIQEFQKKKIIKYNSKNQIQFVYIGIIIIREEIIFVLPKYTECMNEDEKKIVLKNIIRLLNDFSERENLNNSDIEHIDFEKESLENNLISIISFLIDDYIEYGIYKNEIDYIELNGNGDINWDITIDQIDPIVIDSQWIYTDLFTNMSKVDNNKFITLLHGKIINDCIRFLNQTGLDEILGYELTYVENTIDGLDELDIINNEINKELIVQFNDRKRRVLYAIQAYIERRAEVNNTNLQLYGTRNFKWVWEVICAYIFNNQFISQGKISKYELFGINAPRWNINNYSNSEVKYKNEIEMKKNRLTPDILSVVNINNTKYLLVLDAKYYKLSVSNDKVNGNPGIEDISKQYLYQLSLKEYIEENKIQKVFNIFLLPNYSKTYLQGNVNLDFMKPYCDDGIKLVQLDVNEVIDLYCKSKRYNVEEFIEMIQG